MRIKPDMLLRTFAFSRASFLFFRRRHNDRMAEWVQGSDRSNGRSRESGAVFVEFLFSVLVFFFFVVTAIESLRFGYTLLTANYVLESAARAAAVYDPSPKYSSDVTQPHVGGISTADLNPMVIPPIANRVNPLDQSGLPNNVARAIAIRDHIEAYQQTYHLDFTGPGNVLTICPTSNPNCPAPGDAGNPGDYVRIELKHDFRFVFVAYIAGFTSTTSVIFRNEAYEAKY